MLEMENCCTNNPNQFWDHLNKLGPGRKSRIPVEVYSNTEEILCDKANVLNVWQAHFKSLYNMGQESEHPNTNGVNNAKFVMEQNMIDLLYLCRPKLQHHLRRSKNCGE